ncbi:MAG TPA: squalene synthase HpnC [Alphaproteobacteria bacterium]|nr:squalene synthase HpnC [Alphaproteobacteria bacterium]
MAARAESAGAARQVETPSGKGSRDENFPVGSWLLPRGLRPHVAKFYAFARAIDDIADNPRLSPADKVARLDGFERAILGHERHDPAYEKAHRLRASLEETRVTPQHCLDLIAAFKRDARVLRYQSWSELIEGYCMLSAAPVGRYLLDLHREDPAHYFASDALCNALQVINHLQDCQADYRTLNRVYLPLDWLAAEGETVTSLNAPRASPGMRRVLDRCLAGTEALLVDARKLPGLLRHRRLAYESGVIVALGERLTALLRRRDPIARRVQISGLGFPLVAARGLLRTLFAGRTAS